MYGTNPAEMDCIVSKDAVPGAQYDVPSVSLAVVHQTNNKSLNVGANKDLGFGPDRIRDQAVRVDSTVPPQRKSIFDHVVKQYGSSIFHDVIKRKVRGLFGTESDKNSGVPETSPPMNSRPLPQRRATGCGSAEKIATFWSKKESVDVCIWRSLAAIVHIRYLVAVLYTSLVAFQIAMGAYLVIISTKYCAPDSNGAISFRDITIATPPNSPVPAMWIRAMFNESKLTKSPWNSVRPSDRPEVFLRKLCFRIACSEDEGSCQWSAVGRRWSLGIHQDAFWALFSGVGNLLAIVMALTGYVGMIRACKQPACTWEFMWRLSLFLFCGSFFSVFWICFFKTTVKTPYLIAFFYSS